MRRRRQSGIPAKVRAAVLLRDDYSCRKCGRYVGASGELHHLLKRSQGGQHTEDNLVTLCHEHHGWAESHPLAAVAAGLGVQLRKVA